jgi:hypothetical protein
MLAGVVLIAAMSVTFGVRAQHDRNFSTTSGDVPLSRHPSRLVIGLADGVDAAVVAERVEVELSLRAGNASAEVEHRPVGQGFERYGIALLEVDGVDFRGMAEALELAGADPQVEFAEPVYLVGSEYPLFPHNTIAVRLASEVDADAAARLHDELGGRVIEIAPHDSRLLWIEPAHDNGSVALANLYHARPEVVWAEPDFIKYRVPTYEVDDPQYDDQWHLNGLSPAVAGASVEIEAAFDLAYDTFPLVPSAVHVVGVCDSGVLVDHEDLRVIGDGYDLTGSDVGINPDDSSDGHGTSVSGVAAAHGDNGTGVCGSCPTCGVVGFKLDLPGYVSDSDLFFAFYWAAENYQMPSLNNSWGLDTPWIYIPMSYEFKEAVDTFSEMTRSGKGGVIVFASGNADQLAALDGSTGYIRTVTVGASTCEAHRANYSNYGHAVDVLAPSNGDGCGITTTSMSSSSGYTGNFGGTSSAAPLVSGIVGLMTEANPDINEAQIREALILSAEPIDEDIADYGPSPYVENPDAVFSFTHSHGKVNAATAVQLALDYGDSGCTESYEVCNSYDDDCDGFTDDEYDACNPCELDVETNGREFCDDGIDNDCDGLTDPDDCIEPCEDLKGMCWSCDSGAECWPGLDCSPISFDFSNTFCLKRCVDDSWCPDGFWCETSWTHTCIPEGFSCSGLESEYPDPSCEETEEDAGPDADTDTDTDTDTDGDAGPPDSGPTPPASPESGCGCAVTGGDRPAGLLGLLVSTI